MLNLGGVKESSMEKNHTNIPPWPFFSGFIQTSKRKQLRQIHEGTTQTIVPSGYFLDSHIVNPAPYKHSVSWIVKCYEHFLSSHFPSRFAITHHPKKNIMPTSNTSYCLAPIFRAAEKTPPASMMFQGKNRKSEVYGPIFTIFLIIGTLD